MKFFKATLLFIFLSLTLSCFPRLTEFSENPFAPEIPPIFVQANAEFEGADGTREHPYPTINEGINIAVNTDNPNVMLLAGDYEEQINLENISDLTISGEDKTTVILHNHTGDIDGAIGLPIIFFGEKSNRINIRELTLIADHSIVTQGLVNVLGSSGENSINDVVFESNTLADYGINIRDSGSNYSRFIIENCIFNNFLNTAILYLPRNLYVHNSEINIREYASGILIPPEISLDFSGKFLDVTSSTFNIFNDESIGFNIPSSGISINLGTINFKGNYFNGLLKTMTYGIYIYGTTTMSGQISITENELGEKNYFNGLVYGLYICYTHNLNFYISNTTFGNGSNNVNGDLIFSTNYDAYFYMFDNSFYSYPAATPNVDIIITTDGGFGGYSEIRRNYMNGGQGLSVTNNASTISNWFISDNTINSTSVTIPGLKVTQESSTNYIYLENNYISINDPATFAFTASGAFPTYIYCSSANNFINHASASAGCSGADLTALCSSYCTP